ncbi:hypothetical protein CTEN210_06819 [Chaetoceros tenuissimus]|uniref:Uncharacterized protein n=1 Tax=Chaetoceros tenuissimus TaxID=426638 RepID=A0AAD3H539_9STRA|nr:hypothetical protein CTEN210_06819 [Chaetoceros tenuissimus]
MAPHLLPKDEPNGIWAKGNVASCDGMGFLLHTGMALNQLYTVTLSYYFLKRVKDKVKPPDFAKRYEKLMHASIWIVAVVLNLAALLRKDFNPVESGDLCAMIDKPIDCSLKDDVECIRGENANTDAFFLVVSIIFVVFTLIVSNFARLTNYVYKAEMLMRLEQVEQSARGGQDNEIEVDYSFCKEVTKYFCSCCFRTTPGEEEEELEKESPSLAFESFVQSGLWISIFLLVYIPPTLAFGLKAMGLAHRPAWLFFGPSTLTPLGGALNIIVYTRPKIHKMRRKFPELEESPYFVLFLIVVFSGGECPKDIDFLNSWSEEEEESPNQENESSSIDDSTYERVMQDLLGESMISNDSLFKLFYS